MSNRSEIIVLTLWAAAICGFLGSFVSTVVNNDVHQLLYGPLLGCFLLLNALLVAVLNGRNGG